MRFFSSLFVFILSINCSYCQNSLNYGLVKNDSLFDCNKYMDYNFEKTSICDSKNELEIRLYTVGFPRGNHNLIILSYDKKWRSIRYEAHMSLANEPIRNTIIEDENLSNYKIDSDHIFDSLKANNIFLLANQYELKIKRTICDGVGYLLEFKVKNKFNSYRFSNPESYSNSHPEIKELKQYANIARIMFGLFKQ
jgi:hypothetical protein